nr:secernin-3-like [Parasteatoda tepidariorum]
MDAIFTSGIKTPPKSCDTFAALPPGTLDGCIVFGKNSDRPNDEVQEVVYVPAQDHTDSTKLKCTYIEIDQVPHTYAVILSKPSWMWGAEMGANEHGVCIGNEAVWTTLNDSSDAEKKLLGMDLLRLGLERCKNAADVVHTIVDLIYKYGMGGNCSNTLPNFTYHNSFLIADPSEVWVLECAGKIWAAEKVTEGVRNISNELSIRTKIDLKCEGLEEFAKKKGFWCPTQGPIDFKMAFDTDDSESHRYKAGKRLLTNFSQNGAFSAGEMFKVLRDRNSGICMSSGSFVSTASQVSVLRKTESGLQSCHFFTATPDPRRSAFKPFFFAEEVEFTDKVVSPVPSESEENVVSDRKHELYKLHEDACFSRRDADAFRLKLKELEDKYVSLVDEIVSGAVSDTNAPKDIFKRAVEEECSLFSEN